VGVCRGYGCKNTDLIDAHIIPRGFARDVMGDNKHLLLFSETSLRPSQHGVWDEDLLCATCDNELGKLDAYALNVCRRFHPDEHRGANNWFLMDNVDGDRFATFILSVLWRASISTRPEFRGVSLGPYEAATAEVIFGATPLTSLPSYQLIANRYVGTDTIDLAHYTTPMRVKYDGFKAWCFSLHGFEIVAKLDKRPFPPEMRWLTVNGGTTLTGLCIEFQSSVVGRTLLRIFAGHPSRSADRRSRRD
jgi:hypothetical protein